MCCVRAHKSPLRFHRLPADVMDGNFYFNTLAESSFGLLCWSQSLQTMMNTGVAGHAISLGWLPPYTSCCGELNVLNAILGDWGVWLSNTLTHTERLILHITNMDICFFINWSLNVLVAWKCFKMSLYWKNDGDGTENCLGPLGLSSLLSVAGGHKGSERAQTSRKM